MSVCCANESSAKSNCSQKGANSLLALAGSYHSPCAESAKTLYGACFAKLINKPCGAGRIGVLQGKITYRSLHRLNDSHRSVTHL
jgi:hypothetical protein